MQARLRVGDGGPILPHKDLRFSVENGGGGAISFTTTMSEAATAGVFPYDYSKVIYLEFQTAPSTWTPVYPYALQPPFRRSKVGTVGTVTLNGASVHEAWSEMTVFYPEYTRANMPPGAGTERGLGWMNSAYDWQNDPREPWDKCYVTSRTTLPPEFPTGSGADWISATGASDFSERKLFRSSVTVTGTGVQVLKCYWSSDEGAAVWVAGEKIAETTDVEWGRKYTNVSTLNLYPGTYAVGIDTKTHVTKGGDGVDPVILGICTTDSEGDPVDWLLVTDSSWGACRRDNISGPLNEPPGPTPGVLIQDLIGEAATRGVCGWGDVTFGFTGTTDSYGAAWGVSVERLVRYAMDDYRQFFNALGETEADIWMDANLVLHAAPKQGVVRGYTWTETQINSMSDSIAADYGTVAIGLTLDGWVQSTTGGFRREVGLELGQAISQSVGLRVTDATLAQIGRWDATIQYVPGQVPMLDFGPGDWVTIDYQDLNRQVRILSIAGQAGDGGLLWSLEVTNEPPG